jgi:Ca2+-transporting ATPase
VNRHEHDHVHWELVGDPTEGALLVAAMKAGLDLRNRDHDRVHEIPFDSERKAMSVIARHDSGLTMYSKGAPEVILKLCTRERRDGREQPLDDDRRRAILHAAGRMAANALRVLALAYRTGVDEREERESDLVLAGLAGMIDPPRDEARDAVARCKSAGIRPVMITGDHPDTARAIAIALGIAESTSSVLSNSAEPGHGEVSRGVRLQARNADVSADPSRNSGQALDVTDSRSPDAGDVVVTGQQLDKSSAEALAERVEQIPVYARVSAEHKLRIIDALRQRRHVVAMTGDGVNDAPAVKAADIGIAMGVTGTDVTKEASDMVLTDDNFASIVNAVEEGRTIFDNIRKFVHYLLATNAGEVLTMFFAALVGWPVPLFPIQILWINLVTDALPALALGMEPPEPDVMNRPPRPAQERVVTGAGGLQILTHGLLIACAASIAYWLVYRGDDARLPAARTACFATLAYAQLMYAIGCRSHRFTMPQLGFVTNHWLLGAILVSGLLQLAVLVVPLLQPLFKTAPAFSAGEIAAFAGLALAPVTIIELVKIARAASKPTSS